MSSATPPHKLLGDRVAKWRASGCPKDRERYVLSPGILPEAARGALGFHDEPHDFDSGPEVDFFEQILRERNLKPEEIEDVYFTGAQTSPDMTDFRVESKDADHKWRHYTPDFVIRKKPAAGGRPGTGRTIIVEIKADRERGDPMDGEHGAKAVVVRKWVDLNPDRLRYEMVFASGSRVGPDRVHEIRDALYD